MTDKPRTWTLTRWDNGLYDDYDIAEGPTKLAEEGQVQVIELEPVLDLLERTLETGEPPHDAEVEESVEALLKEHRP